MALKEGKFIIPLAKIGNKEINQCCIIQVAAAKNQAVRRRQ
jgi:hypothetical protein